MKNAIKTCMILCLGWQASHADNYDFAPSKQHPYGRANTSAPAAVKDFAPLIGRSECLSTARIDQNNWADPIKMIWVFKYIMNGMGVQDETLKSDGSHGGSLRQYDPESKQWMVHYYTTKVVPSQLPSWQGGVEGGDLVFRKEQQAPNGMDGKYRLTFHNITPESFEWKGEWVDVAEQVIYPTWKISCVKKS